jgi:two-component system, response regulator
MQTRTVDIVLVEDSDFDAELTIRALSKCNLHRALVHLRDGAAALEYLFSGSTVTGKKNSGFPRLILMDLKMPKINGLELLQRLKAEESTRSIPVVVLTSSNEEQDIETCYKYGVNSYIVKPLEFEQYIRTITDLSSYWLIHNRSIK